MTAEEPQEPGVEENGCVSVEQSGNRAPVIIPGGCGDSGCDCCSGGGKKKERVRDARLRSEECV